MIPLQNQLFNHHNANVKSNIYLAYNSNFLQMTHFVLGEEGKGRIISGVGTTIVFGKLCLGRDLGCPWWVWKALQPHRGASVQISSTYPQTSFLAWSRTETNWSGTLILKAHFFQLPFSIYIIDSTYHMILHLFIYITVLPTTLQTSTEQGITFNSTYIQFLIPNMHPLFDGWTKQKQFHFLIANIMRN